jgi:hypothetical protein
VSAVFDEVDLVAMFGASACVDGNVDPCEPLAEAAAWARMVNQFRSPGHCEGLVVEALTRFNEGALPPTVELENQGEVTKAILRSFASQFLDSVRREASAWQDVSVSRIVDEIGSSLRDGELDYTLGLYVKEGGHAVLPYAVEVRGEELVRIHVYDSNWPGRDRFVDVDLSNGRWEFSFASEDPATDPNPWRGGAGSIDLASLASRRAGSCPFCESESTVRNSVLLIKSSEARWSITTDGGMYSPTTGTPVSGVSVHPVRSATAGAPIDYLVEVEGSQFELNLPDPTTVYISRSRTVMQIEAEDGLLSPVRVLSDSIAASDPGARLTVAYSNLVARVQAPEAKVRFLDEELAVDVRTETDEPYRIEVTPEDPSVDIREGSVSREPTSINEISAELPAVLRAGAVKFALPEMFLRNLANPDYLAEVQGSVRAPGVTVVPPTVPSSTTVGTLKPIGVSTTSTTKPVTKGTGIATTTTTVKPAKSQLLIGSTSSTAPTSTTVGTLKPIVVTTTTTSLPKTTTTVGTLKPIVVTTTTTNAPKTSGNLFTTTTVGSSTK